MNRSRTLPLVCAGALVVLGGAIYAQQKQDTLGYQDTPLLPGGKWHVHDGLRPQPKVIDPGTASTQDAPGRPPSDAVVLFDGKDLSHWRSDKDNSPAQWNVENGELVIKPGAGAIHTTDTFQDCQIHVEFCEPTVIKGNGQGRGNSGVFLYGLYEFQVLDSFNNPTYPDGQAGALYGQYPPLVNASRAPGQWQTYDIFFTAPRFDGNKLLSPAYATIVHNGVLVQNHAKIMGPMFHKQYPKYIPHPPRGPLGLQDHGNPVRYRNIWVREIQPYDQVDFTPEVKS
jgi:hypothetical protein